MTAPAEELRAAAEKIRALVAAIDAPDLPDQSWHTEACADEERGDCPCIVAQGSYEAEPSGMRQPLYYVADAETPECATYIAAMGPPVALAIAKSLDDTRELHEPKLRGHAGAIPPGCQWCADEDFPCLDMRNALAIARAINGPVAAS